MCLFYFIYLTKLFSDIAFNTSISPFNTNLCIDDLLKDLEFQFLKPTFGTKNRVYKIKLSPATMYLIESASFVLTK